MHHYNATVHWTGNTGAGTATYRSYSRAHDITADGKATIAGSSEPRYRGDATRWNPEELLVAALAACHQLWYLHLCADSGIIVTGYSDRAYGTLGEDPDGAPTSFTSVVLRPHATLKAGADPTRAIALHADAAAKCGLARSVNFPVTCEPTVEIERG